MINKKNKELLPLNLLLLSFHHRVCNLDKPLNSRCDSMAEKFGSHTSQSGWNFFLDLMHDDLSSMNYYNCDILDMLSSTCIDTFTPRLIHYCHQVFGCANLCLFLDTYLKSPRFAGRVAWQLEWSRTLILLWSIHFINYN